MNKKVLIQEIATGKVITIDEINLKAVNYEPSEQEWFNLAWENAVEDGLVNEKDKEKYSITFV